MKEMGVRMVADKEGAVRVALAEASARAAAEQQQVVAALEAKLARTNEALQLALARLQSSPPTAVSPEGQPSEAKDLTLF